jgi:hypothetical protein
MTEPDLVVCKAPILRAKDKRDSVVFGKTGQIWGYAARGFNGRPHTPGSGGGSDHMTKIRHCFCEFIIYLYRVSAIPDWSQNALK